MISTSQPTDIGGAEEGITTDPPDTGRIGIVPQDRQVRPVSNGGTCTDLSNPNSPIRYPMNGENSFASQFVPVLSTDAFLNFERILNTILEKQEITVVHHKNVEDRLDAMEAKLDKALGLQPSKSPLEPTERKKWGRGKYPRKPKIVRAVDEAPQNAVQVLEKPAVVRREIPDRAAKHRPRSTEKRRKKRSSSRRNNKRDALSYEEIETDNEEQESENIAEDSSDVLKPLPESGLDIINSECYIPNANTNIISPLMNEDPVEVRTSVTSSSTSLNLCEEHPELEISGVQAPPASLELLENTPVMKISEEPILASHDNKEEPIESYRVPSTSDEPYLSGSSNPTCQYSLELNNDQNACPDMHIMEVSGSQASDVLSQDRTNPSESEHLERNHDCSSPDQDATSHVTEKEVSDLQISAASDHDIQNSLETANSDIQAVDKAPEASILYRESEETDMGESAEPDESSETIDVTANSWSHETVKTFLESTDDPAFNPSSIGFDKILEPNQKSSKMPTSQNALRQAIPGNNSGLNSEPSESSTDPLILEDSEVQNNQTISMTTTAPFIEDPTETEKIVRDHDDELRMDVLLSLDPITVKKETEPTRSSEELQICGERDVTVDVSEGPFGTLGTSQNISELHNALPSPTVQDIVNDILRDVEALEMQRSLEVNGSDLQAQESDVQFTVPSIFLAKTLKRSDRDQSEFAEQFFPENVLEEEQIPDEVDPTINHQDVLNEFLEQENGVFGEHEQFVVVPKPCVANRTPAQSCNAVRRSNRIAIRRENAADQVVEEEPEARAISRRRKSRRRREPNEDKIAAPTISALEDVNLDIFIENCDSQTSQPPVSVAQPAADYPEALPMLPVTCDLPVHPDHFLGYERPTYEDQAGLTYYMPLFQERHPSWNWPLQNHNFFHLDSMPPMMTQHINTQPTDADISHPEIFRPSEVDIHSPMLQIPPTVQEQDIPSCTNIYENLPRPQPTERALKLAEERKKRRKRRNTLPTDSMVEVGKDGENLKKQRRGRPPKSQDLEHRKRGPKATKTTTPRKKAKLSGDHSDAAINETTDLVSVSDAPIISTASSSYAENLTKRSEAVIPGNASSVVIDESPTSPSREPKPTEEHQNSISSPLDIVEREETAEKTLEALGVSKTDSSTSDYLSSSFFSSDLHPLDGRAPQESETSSSQTASNQDSITIGVADDWKHPETFGPKSIPEHINSQTYFDDFGWEKERTLAFENLEHEAARNPSVQITTKGRSSTSEQARTETTPPAPGTPPVPVTPIAPSPPEPTTSVQPKKRGRKKKNPEETSKKVKNNNSGQLTTEIRISPVPKHQPREYSIEL